MVVVVVLMYELIDARPIYDQHNAKQKLQLSLEVAASVLVCMYKYTVNPNDNSYDIYLQKFKYFDGILKDCDKTSFFEISKIFVGLASASQYQHIHMETIKNLQEKAIKAMVSLISTFICTSLTFCIHSFIDRKMF